MSDILNIFKFRFFVIIKYLKKPYYNLYIPIYFLKYFGIHVGYN